MLSGRWSGTPMDRFWPLRNQDLARQNTERWLKAIDPAKQDGRNLV